MNSNEEKKHLKPILIQCSPAICAVLVNLVTEQILFSAYWHGFQCDMSMTKTGQQYSPFLVLCKTGF